MWYPFLERAYISSVNSFYYYFHPAAGLCGLQTMDSVLSKLNLCFSLLSLLSALTNTLPDYVILQFLNWESRSPTLILPIKDWQPDLKKKVAPNQGSWRETANVMGVEVKGSKKRKHTDAYAGGEQSGSSAKPDAKVPLKYATDLFWCSTIHLLPSSQIQGHKGLTNSHIACSPGCLTSTCCCSICAPRPSAYQYQWHDSTLLPFTLNPEQVMQGIWY